MGDIRLGSKVRSGCRMLKITIGVTGLREDSGRDNGIERRFGSGLRDRAKIWVGMTGLKKP